MANDSGRRLTAQPAGVAAPLSPQAVSALPGAHQAQVDPEDWYYLWKWVERGLFCPHTTAKTALECLAHHPSAPWHNERWDVDHKPYAEAFYKAFPESAEDQQ